MTLIINPKKEFGEDLSRNSGHVFFIEDKDNFDSIINEIENDIPAQQVKILKAISLNVSKIKNYTTVSHIEKYLEFPRATINKVISKIATNKILTPIEFKLSTNTSLSRSRCFQPIAKSEWVDLLTKLQGKKKKGVNKKVTKEYIKTKILTEYGLPEHTIDNEVNSGVFPSKLPPFHLLLPSHGYKSNLFITHTKMQGKPVVVEVRSSDDTVMFDEDIKTLYTLMTLFINQQANSLDFYIQKQSAPTNSHYVEIRHIMKALNKPSAGSYYDKFVKSIMRIKRTTFDLHQVESFYTDPHTGESLFGSADFRFFESCFPISSTGVVVDKDVDNNEFIQINPKGFIIKWHEAIFNKMLTDNYFFVIPLKILSSPTVIFKIYMMLRTFFSKDLNQKSVLELSIDDLHEKLSSNSKIHNFKRDLIAAFNTWNKPIGLKLQGSNMFEFDMLGFRISLDLLDNNIEHLRFSLDKQEMLNCLGIRSDHNGKIKGISAAPTKLNPIKEYLPILEKFRDTRGNEFPQELNTRLVLAKILTGIEINKYSNDTLIITKDSHSWHLSRYSPLSEILRISEILHPSDIEAQKGFYTHITTKVSKLALLATNNSGLSTELSIDKFELLSTVLLNRFSIYMEANEFFNFLRTRHLLIKIFSDSWDGSEDSDLLNVIVKEYRESKESIIN